MAPARSHPVDARVALRSVHQLPGRGPTVTFGVAGVVLEDDQEHIVVATPTGSDRAHRGGPRAGPRGRNTSEADWDGRYDIAAWEGATAVRVHPRGQRWSIWRWHDGNDWLAAWYGNLESPWQATAIGYDTEDWALDVVARGVPGTTDWVVGLKDEDELEWFVDQGRYTSEQARRIRLVGQNLADLLQSGQGLTNRDWSRWVPPTDL